MRHVDQALVEIEVLARRGGALYRRYGRGRGSSFRVEAEGGPGPCDGALVRRLGGKKQARVLRKTRRGLAGFGQSPAKPGEMIEAGFILLGAFSPACQVAQLTAQPIEG